MTREIKILPPELEGIASRLASVRTVDDLIRTVEDILEEIVEVEYNGLYLFDPTIGKLRLYYAKGFTESERIDAEKTAMERHPGYVYKTGKAIHIPDVRLDPNSLTRDSRRSFHILSRLFLPVKSYDKTVGAFGLVSTEANKFTEEHISVLSFVCNLAGVVYSNLLYARQQDESSRIISQYQDQLKFLADTAMELIGIQDEEDVFRYIKDRIIQLMPDNVVIINQIIDDKAYTKDILGVAIAKLINQIKKFGWDPFEKPFPISEKFRNIFKLGKIYRFPGGFREFDEGNIPEIVKKFIERVFKFREALTIGIAKGPNLYGAVHVFLRENDRIPEYATLESFINQCATVIQQIRLKQDLVAARVEAEAASQAKAQFLSMMSHEIRTPLNAVIGLTHILLMDQPREDQVESLKSIRFSADNLLVIINDILDYNKIEAGKIEFETIDFRIDEFMNGILNSFRLLASEKDLELKLDADPTLPDVLTGDRTRLAQILINLLSNAIKFTSEGSVTLKIRKTGTRQRQVLLRFEVIDTGIGIEKEAIERVFQDFVQARMDTTRKYGGTGLGLAITKKLVEMQGGKIRVSSQVGKGTTFIVEMPFYYTEHVAEPTVHKEMNFEPLPGVRVLLAEDNKINQLVAKQFLNRWGIEFTIAENGQQAIDALKEDHFDLVLMDLEMPVMDGYEATRQIRKLSDQKKSSIPIMALSASAMLDIREKAKNYGMDSFVTKPFEPCELYTAIRDLVGR
jgi:signal transduction histidine kinase/CheY-like chemotaxis protein/putative methionine-R-sulfoxide reductase with GAF domain